MDEKSGSSLPGFLVGLTVLILTGIGLSLLVQRRLQSSIGNREIREQIETREQEISDLKNWRTRLEDQFNAEARTAVTRTTELRETLTVIREKEARLAQLRLAARNLRQECETLAASSHRYRTAYCTSIRQGAVGEKVGTLKLANGREFTGVSIVRVTDTAMEILHDAGRARIPGKDLPSFWSARFQWEE